jgi:excisionase family DNA binding protein
MKSKQNYYSIKEIADYFGVSDATIRTQVLSGKIKSIRVGILYRIPRKEFEKLLTNKFKEDVLVKT